ncbi:hypothetical protein [Henriciella sp.]|uniref:hypothetical protein n=1 Tax=Henriciella sp. TaxID=1968823 RepID=UPI002619EF22|nr:hypothetical protein [Henriciella sp.]
MRHLASLAAIALLAIPSGCNTTQKSHAACESDVDRLKDAIRDTSAYLEDLRPRLKASFLALDACDRVTTDCDAAAWLAQAEAMRAEHLDRHAEFNRAVDLWWPDACVPYIQSYRINPPDPKMYKGYFYSLDETGKQIDELIERYSKRVAT